MATSKPLSSLLQIIAAGVADIEARCESLDLQYPSLDDAPTPETQRIQAMFTEESLPIIAATHQLMATLMTSRMFFSKISGGVLQSTALSIVEAGHVAEILREAGPQGLHVKDITKHTALEPTKLAHFLRFLSSLHVFKEVSPDHFAHNRVSHQLDTGKAVSDILANPEAKYDGAIGSAAFTSLSADIGTKTAAHAVATFTDPAISHSQDPADSALQRAFGTRMDMFSWYELPENAQRLRKFVNGMKAQTQMATAPVLGGFDWAAIPEGGVVVDVGSGVGGMAVELKKHFSHLKYVAQDRQPVIDEAVKIFGTGSGTDDLSLQVHDFFNPQPVKNAAAFVLRFILHNWNDASSIRILQNLRDVAQPETRLIIIDNVLPYNCPSDGAWSHIPGGEAPSAPAPLLPNFGIACSDASYLDVVSMQFSNTHERTLDEVNALLVSSGWRLERVHRFPPPGFPQVVAIPI